MEQQITDAINQFYRTCKDIDWLPYISGSIMITVFLVNRASCTQARYWAMLFSAFVITISAILFSSSTYVATGLISGIIFTICGIAYLYANTDDNEYIPGYTTNGVYLFLSGTTTLFAAAIQSIIPM